MNTKKLFFVFIFLFLFFPQIVFAEVIKENKNYPIDSSRFTGIFDGIEADDGSYYGIYFTYQEYPLQYNWYLVKYDSYGNVVWENSYLTGEERPVVLTLDEEGNIYVLMNYYHNIYTDFLTDGTMIDDRKLVVFSPQGTILKEIELTDHLFFNSLKRIRIYNDHIYLLGEEYFQFNGEPVDSSVDYYSFDVDAQNVLVSLDLDGTFNWKCNIGGVVTNTFSFLTPDYQVDNQASYVVMSENDFDDIVFDGNYLYVNGVNRFASIAKVSLEGEKIWDKDYGGTDNLFQNSVCDLALNPNGGVVAIMDVEASSIPELNGETGRKSILVSINSDGDIDSFVVLDGEGRNVIHKDYGYYVTIYISSYSAPSDVLEYYGSAGMFVLKYDHDFQLIDFYHVETDHSYFNCFTEGKEGIYICSENESLLNLTSELEEKSYSTEIKKNKDITSIIPCDHSLENVEWYASDDEIATVVGNQIVPLKKGRTTITFIVDRVLYHIDVVVTEDMLNPKTGRIFYWILAFLIGSFLFFFIDKRFVRIKTKE